jgi:hypothetical protein
MKKPTAKEEAERLFREMRQDLARKGGLARAAKLSAKRRSEIAKKASAARKKK